MPNSLLAKLTTMLEMIKFSHTVFAFPFALMGVVLASLESGNAPTFGQVFWVCLAMVGARTGAMGLNRILDARIDAENPRTADRHLPTGKVHPAEAWLLVLGAFSLLLVAAWMLNPLCLKLAPVAIFFLALYSVCKRHSTSCRRWWNESSSGTGSATRGSSSSCIGLSATKIPVSSDLVPG